MDDLGGIKIVFRFACDQAPLQVDDPSGTGYVRAVASNGSTVKVRYDPRGNARPWYKCLHATLVSGGLHPGDTITLFLGGTGEKAPGTRLQTFCETRFEFKVLVDVFSTNTYVELPSPSITITPGEPVLWIAILPTLTRVNERFRLSIKANDRWGNPSSAINTTVFLSATRPVKGLPERVTFCQGDRAKVIEHLEASEAGEVRVRLQGAGGTVLAESNALVVRDVALVHAWGDLHGQSVETIGTNSALDYFEFARDLAFLDVTGHQGNDFQINKAFWKELENLTKKFNEPGRFITIPGYEWSGNTAVGGDRNVYFKNEGRQIRRSSHVLIPDDHDETTDCHSAGALFSALAPFHDEVVIVPHAGGRYADIKASHDARMEHSVEIHSAWGTFEWLLHDAFEEGYRVGVVATSDDHKGRPGASYPGASKFGTLGGLTCFLVQNLTRDAVFDALKRRHHYATTGARIFLDARVKFKEGGKVYPRDPLVFPEAGGQQVTEAIMGDIVCTAGKDAELHVECIGTGPVERIEVFDGTRLLETFRPGASEKPLSRKVRISWEGAEYRGRNRNTTWNGKVTITGNVIEKAIPINFWNVDSPLRGEGTNTLSWETITAGNIQGMDVLLRDPIEGTIHFQSNQATFDIPTREITHDDTIFTCAGLGKRVKIYRVPEENTCTRLNFHRAIEVAGKGDTRIFVKMTQEDGHQAWSSPVYLHV